MFFEQSKTSANDIARRAISPVGDLLVDEGDEMIA